MKLSIFTFFILISVVFSGIAQSNLPIFCPFPASFKGSKIDSDLKDYFEYEICNQSDNNIVGVIFSYKKDYHVINKAGKEAFRSKVSVNANSNEIVKLYPPFYEKYEKSNIVLTKFIYNDGNTKKVMESISL